MASPHHSSLKSPACFVTVIGNAGLVKSEVAYDVIDDADLTPEQVASIIMDLLDDMIAVFFSI